MQTIKENLETRAPETVVSPAPDTAASAPLTGIERLMAEALIALDGDRPRTMSEPGAIEYASWMRLLRRATP